MPSVSYGPYATDGNEPFHPERSCATDAKVYHGTKAQEIGCYACNSGQWLATACPDAGGNCSADNHCFINGFGQAIDGNDPNNLPKSCADPSDTTSVRVGTDTLICYACRTDAATGQSAWQATTESCAGQTILPNCSTTNHCYLTASGQATDGTNPTHPETSCTTDTTSAYPGTGDASAESATCWRCTNVNGGWVWSAASGC